MVKDLGPEISKFEILNPENLRSSALESKETSKDTNDVETIIEK